MASNADTGATEARSIVTGPVAALIRSAYGPWLDGPERGWTNPAASEWNSMVCDARIGHPVATARPVAGHPVIGVYRHVYRWCVIDLSNK
jgi:hypothetical protein